MTIRIKDSTTYEDGKQNVDVALASTDTKPTDVATGSTMVETDTGKSYVFDEDSAKWTETKSGGGGGGSSSGVFWVNVLYDEDTDVESLDKTTGEILNALEAGNEVFSMSVQEISAGTTITSIGIMVGTFVQTNPATYVFTFFSNGTTMAYGNSDPDGYPTLMNE